MLVDIVVELDPDDTWIRGVFTEPLWELITQTLNEQTGLDFITPNVIRRFRKIVHRLVSNWCSSKGNPKAQNLRKKGCPNYDKLKQLFAPSTGTGALQIFSNTPALDSDEERALEEEMANEANPTNLEDDDCYTPNLDSIPRREEDTTVDGQTQRANKHPMQEPSVKGKKVSKKGDRVSDMTTALKEYTAMTKERFSGKRGKASGGSDQFAKSAIGGDPCSLGKAIQILNQYEDLDNKSYVEISMALQQKEHRVVFIGMPEHRRKTWMDEIVNPSHD
ncbi:hypothetical protein SO802_010505 [Lithocarpus litseifolius]|uniref:Myb/SANT-like domain-containing protein n=1 Tax=Lithocarpus litseifolius TaxID=425828 RepID=A0AAW2DEE4_9ROSI